jgi:hypothetical protein
MVSFQATRIEIEESFILATGPRMLRSKANNKEKVRSFSKRARSYICAYYALEHTKQNINTNDNETINHDEMALLSCVLTFCAFHFNWKFCDAHVNEIKIEAKKRGRSALAASS